jgi:hypothetical protein
METYQAIQKVKQDKVNMADEWNTDPVGEDLAELPPTSTIDTNSNGAQLRMLNEDDNSDIYVPSEREANSNDGSLGDNGSGDSDVSMEELYQHLYAKRKEKKVSTFTRTQ